MERQRDKISACVITGNEEQKIEACLQSLAWCDEIVIVDSFSDDQTVEICRKYTDRVYQHEWLGYIGQRNLIRELARYEWILHVDADEVVSPALRDEVLETFRSGVTGINGFQFPRMVYYLGKWIRHGEWYPDMKLRLFRREKGRSEGEEPHDAVMVEGPVRKMRSPLWHYTYDDLTDHLDTMNRFTSIAAEAKMRDGKTFRWIDYVFRPGWRFFKAYIIKCGFLDGQRGFLIAGISSFGVAIKYAKLWELSLKKKGVITTSVKKH